MNLDSFMEILKIWRIRQISEIILLGNSTDDKFESMFFHYFFFSILIQKLFYCHVQQILRSIDSKHLKFKINFPSSLQKPIQYAEMQLFKEE